MTNDAVKTRLMEETRIEQVRTGLVSFNAIRQEIILEVEVITRTPTLQMDLQIADPPEWRRGRYGAMFKLSLEDLYQLPKDAQMPILSMMKLKDTSF